MDSSTGISLNFVKATLAAFFITPIMLTVMWFGTGVQLNNIEDKLDMLQAQRQQQPTLSCTTSQEGVWIWRRTIKSCTGGTEK